MSGKREGGRERERGEKREGGTPPSGLLPNACRNWHQAAAKLEGRNSTQASHMGVARLGSLDPSWLPPGSLHFQEAGVREPDHGSQEPISQLPECPLQQY